MPRRLTLPSSLALVVPLALAGAVLLAPDRPAHACGGCFSPTTAPTDDLVVQDGERVLFHRDPATNVTTVWVEVRYTGAAEEFGWVLPLEKPPTVGTGPRYLFDLLDQSLGVQHRTLFGAQENCESPWIGCEPQQYPSEPDFAVSDTATTADASTGGGDGGPNGVTVIDQGQTGPYDYVVISADDAQLLYDWLNDKGYSTPAAATPILESHIAKGDVFVAVKLQNGAGVDLIRPITLTMQGADACVPLRLTSIAAQDDMTVSVTLAGPGRAVPKNLFNVVVNPARLNWFAGANNYRQVVAAAIDEAAGHAFVTEFAGRGTALASPGASLRQAEAAVAEATTAYEVGRALSDSPALPVTDETGAIFADHVALGELAPGVSASKALAILRACVAYWDGFMPADLCSVEGIDLERSTVEASAVDGAALAAALDADFVAPISDTLELLSGSPTVTRLMMRISPDEMDRDPIFDFNASLPDVSNIVEATVGSVCTTGWWPADARRLTLDGLGSWVIPDDTASSALDPRFAEAPLALRVELLDASGPPQLIAPGDVALVDTAIVGATPGTPSLPEGMVLKTAEAWTPPESDPTVTGRAAWPMPYGCTPLAGWIDGELPPGGQGGGDVTGGDAVTGADAGVGGTTTKADDGCAAGGDTAPLGLALALVLLALLRCREVQR